MDVDAGHSIALLEIRQWMRARDIPVDDLDTLEDMLEAILSAGMHGAVSMIETGPR